ncbi:MAG TPA: RICIN domain-containing protein [Polyangia bacterium]|nr:RICIN domain-containing protein [Polyangia bacterium]
MKIFSVRAGLFLTVVSGFFAAAAPAKADVVRTGYSVFVAGNSGKCLDITGASNTVGTAAIQWHCNFAGNEQWTLQPHNGAFLVVEQKNGQCLAAASTAAGAAIVQTTCTGAATQDWKLTAAAGGYQLVNQGSALCANVNGNSVADNAAIVQSSCSTASNFIWTVASGMIAPAAPVVAQADHSGQCLNVNGASTASGATIIQWPCAGSANEQWKLVPAGTGYQVVSVSSGLCAAVTGSSTTAGASVVQLACSQAANMIWTLNVAGGAYQLVAQHSGQCLTVSGASQTNGAQVVQNTCTAGALNQSWSLSSATIPSSWTGVQTLAVNPIAVANLPSGKLLMWSAYDQYTYEGDIGTANGKTFTSVFDPATGSSSSILVTNTGDDMFCPGTANLPDGRILVNGGSSSPKTSIYDPTTATWSSSGRMNIPRGYQGDTLISTGSVFTLGGSWSGGQGNKDGELWTNGVWSRLTGVTSAPVTGPDPQGVYRGDNHLWLFATSGGQIFHAGPSAPMHWITTTGNGTITSPGNRGDDAYAINGDAVLYDVGTILKAGGAPAYQNTTASGASYVIKFTGGVTVNKIVPLAYPRAFATGVALPNGQVVIVGGQTTPVPFSDNTAILVPEIWDPATRVFRQMKPMQTSRVYHSTAILLPDGRVYVGGGGQCGQGCSANHFNTEILTPPYLLNPDGSAAARPSITTAPATGTLGGTLAVTTGAPVTSFVLMRLSSVTHTVNNDQRRIPLAIKSTSGATSYTLTIPADPGVVLPGYYMLFALNAQGVPSVAATVRIG